MAEPIPELVESLLVSLKHVPEVEVEVVGCEPLLQLLEVGILRKAHGVCLRGGGGLAVGRWSVVGGSALLAWLEWQGAVQGEAF